jgi:ABC-type uncharacterized transport system auxiliary subunit
MRAGWIAVALLAAGCVFRTPPDTRFFRPASAALNDSVEAPSRADGIPLRLRPVRGTPLLRERIVWRASSVEYGLYEQRRWTELPASYVERALEGALRATQGIRLTGEPGAAVLRVEVVAFDEVLAPARVAAVSLEVELVDSEQLRLIDRTFSAEAPIANERAAATAVAMGKALDEAVAAVAGAVAGTLRDDER